MDADEPVFAPASGSAEATPDKTPGRR